MYPITYTKCINNIHVLFVVKDGQIRKQIKRCSNAFQNKLLNFEISVTHTNYNAIDILLIQCGNGILDISFKIICECI